MIEPQAGDQGGDVVLRVPGGQQHQRHDHDVVHPGLDQVRRHRPDRRHRQLDEAGAHRQARGEQPQPLDQGEQLAGPSFVPGPVRRDQQRRRPHEVHGAPSW
jgi:hypothetical protein